MTDGQAALASEDFLGAATCFRRAWELRSEHLEAAIAYGRALDREASVRKPRPAGETARLRRDAAEAFLAVIDRAGASPPANAARAELTRLARVAARECMADGAVPDEALWTLSCAARAHMGWERDELRRLAIEVAGHALVQGLRPGLTEAGRVAVLRPRPPDGAQDPSLDQLGQLVSAGLKGLHPTVTTPDAAVDPRTLAHPSGRAEAAHLLGVDVVVLIEGGKLLSARLLRLRDGVQLATAAATNPLAELSSADEQVARYQRTPFDVTTEPLHVLVYGRGEGADKATALSAALVAARAEAVSACATKVQVDLRRITFEGVPRLDASRLSSDVAESERRILARSEGTVREALPREGSPVYVARPGGAWECHLQLAIPSVDLLPMKTMEEVLRLPDDQVVPAAERLALTLQLREHHGLLANFHASLARRFPERAEHHLAYARTLAEQLGLHNLGHEVLRRALAIARDFDRVGGRQKFEQVVAAFAERVYDWRHYRHEIEGLLGRRRDAEGARLKVTKSFPDRVKVRADTELVFTVAGDARRYHYFLWFDGESLGFAPESGQLREGAFAYRCSPGTVKSEVLLVVVAGATPWAGAPLEVVFERTKVDAREEREVARVRAFLSDLDSYLEASRAVSASVAFEQID